MSKISDATFSLLALSKIPGVSNKVLHKISTIDNFHTQSIESLARFSPEMTNALTLNPSCFSDALNWADGQIKTSMKYGAEIISPFDSSYPLLLLNTVDRPNILFTIGDIPKNNRSVAIVGTREPTHHSKVITDRITSYFCENGWSIVSGLALGCDSIAHRTAINNKSHTVAVMAHGLDMVYPYQNENLAKDILKSGGALISEYPFFTKPEKKNYVKRDHVQAGLSQGVVMIASSLTGGSLHASRASLKYGRWLAVPEPTQKDLENMCSNIQANTVITGNDFEQKTKLLRCNLKQLSMVINLKDKQDCLLLASKSKYLRP